MCGWRWLLVLGLVLLGQPARADLIVSFGSAVVAPGGTTTLDVYVRSTTGTDTLTSFSLEYLLELDTPGGTATLSFVAPQSDSQLTDAGYLLFGNSLAEFFPFTTITTTTDPDDTYLGGDGALLGLVLVPTTDTLLTRFDLTAGAGTPGSVYRISLLPSLFTGFYDENFNPVPFAAGTGFVTVSAETVIPEPATLLLVGMAVTAAAFPWRRRADA